MRGDVGERDCGRLAHGGRRARPARRHARDPRTRGDDRPPALGRLRPAARLRLPRPDPRLDRPGGNRGRHRRRLCARRPDHELPPRPRRRDRQGLRRDPGHVRRRAPGAGPGRRGRRTARRCSRRPSRSTSTARSRSCSARRRATATAAAAACTSATSRPGTSAPTPSSGARCRSPPAPPWPPATERSDRVVCCFAGDGAYANGVVLESLNWAAQAQWTNHLAGDEPYGLPVIYLVVNNHYGMTHRTDDEVMGVGHLARRAAGFADDNMQAEVVNGMDVLAVRDALARAAARCREPAGAPSSSRPPRTATTATPCPIRATSTGRARRRPPGASSTRSSASSAASLAAGAADEAAIAAVEAGARERNARAAVRAAAATDPDPADVLRYLYTDTAADVVPAAARAVATLAAPPVAKRDAAGAITYRDALREALVEEMAPRRAASSSTARTSPTTAARSSSPRASSRRSGAGASSTRRSPRPPSAAPRSAPRSRACARWSSSCTWTSRSWRPTRSPTRPASGTT